MEGSWWFYAPNKALPIVFAVLFLITGSWHLYQNITYKCWRATGLLPIGAFVFTVGYCLREVAAFHDSSIGWYMATTITILCSPPVYEAVNCFILGRFLYYVPYKAPLHPWRLMVTFATFSSITESVNSNGASKATTPYGGVGNQTAGHILMCVSLMMQITSMICFIAVALRFEYNCRRADIFPSKLRNSLRILYVSCALISVRTLYRAVEWYETRSVDPSNPASFPPVLQHEAFFYVFEASVMLLNSFLLNIFHPTRYLPENYKVYLAPDGVTEIEGSGLGRDPRKKWLQLVDPFDIYGLFTNRDQNYNVWAPEPDTSSIRSTSDGASETTEKEKEKMPWGNWPKDEDLVRVVA